jgi:TP901 family phage tail tape measure protein
MANQNSVEIAIKILDINTANIEKLNKSLLSVKTAADSAIAKINEISDAVKKIEPPKSLSAIASELKKLENIKFSGFNQVSEGLSSMTKINLGTFAAKITGLETQLNRLSKINLDSLASVLKNLENTSLGKIEKELKKVEKATQDVGQVAERSGRRIRSFSESFETVMRFRIISALLVGINNAFRSGLKAIIEYDQALKDLQAITGATSLEVAQMGVKILEVASTTKFSASEVAEGMRVIGQSGFSARESIQTMQAVSDLATGTLSDMASTVDLVTTAMRVFDVDASQSASVVDTFANAVNKSKLTVDKLRIAMNYVGPIARSAGVTFQELSASMGLLANSGIRASTIGTGLRRIFAELAAPTEKLQRAALNAGVALNDLDPTSKGLATVLDNLKLVLSDTGVAFDIFGKRGAASALALVSGEADFRAMQETVSQTGTAAAMAETQMKGLGVSFKNLKDRVGVLAVIIGEGGLATVMRVLIDLGSSITSVFTTLAGSTFGKFIMVAGAVVLSTKAISDAFTFLGTKVKVIQDLQIAMLLLRMRMITVAQAAGVVWVALLPLVKVASLFGIIAISIDLLRGDLKKQSEEASKTSDVYGELAKTVSNYEMSLIGIDKESKQAKEANLNLRNSLQQTKNEFTEISKEAYDVIASIDAVTGNISEGSTAIEVYAKKLDDLQFSKLITSANLANDVLKDQSGIISQIGNQWIDFFSGGWKNYGQMVSALKESTHVANLLKKGLEESGVGFSDLQDIITRWDHTKLNNQQKEIIESFNLINEAAGKTVDYLIKTNKVGLDDTLENIKKFAETTGATGMALDAIVDKLARMKELSSEGFSNVIEKWAQDTSVSINELIAEYKSLGGVISENEEIEIRSIDASQKSLVDRLNYLKTVKEAEIASGVSKKEAAENYYTAERKLLKESEEINKRRAESVVLQNMLMLKKTQEDLEISLAKIAKKYEGNDDLIVKHHQKAIAEYLKTEEKLLKGTSIDYKMQTILYKQHLEEIKNVHGEHLNDLAIQESKGLITTEEFNKLKLAANVDLNTKLLEEAKRYQEQVLKADDPEEYEKRQLLVLKAEQNILKSRLEETIASNKEIRNEEIRLQKEKLDAQKNEYNSYLEEMESDYAKHVESLSLEEVKGLITYEEFTAKKLDATVAMYAEMLVVAKKYQEEIAKGENDATAIASAEAATRKAEQDLSAALTKQNHFDALQQRKAELEAHKKLIKSQNDEYATWLAKKEKLHSKTLNSILEAEAGSAEQTERFAKQKLELEVTSLSEKLKKAKEYKDKVTDFGEKELKEQQELNKKKFINFGFFQQKIDKSKAYDPAELQKRNLIFLRIEKELEEAKLRLKLLNIANAKKAEQNAQKLSQAEKRTAYEIEMMQAEVHSKNLINNLSLLLASEKITQEEFNSLKLKEEVVLREKLYDLAKDYHESVSKLLDRKEWENSHKEELDAKQRLEDAKFNLTKENLEVLAKLEKDIAKEKYVELETQHRDHLERMQIQNRNYLNNVEIEEAKGLLTQKEAYDKKLQATVTEKKELFRVAQEFEKSLLQMEGTTDEQKQKARENTKQAEQAVDQAWFNFRLNLIRMEVDAAKKASEDIVKVEKERNQRIFDMRREKESETSFPASMDSSSIVKLKGDVAVNKLRLDEARKFLEELHELDSPGVYSEQLEKVLELEKEYDKSALELRIASNEMSKKIIEERFSKEHEMFKKLQEEEETKHAKSLLSLETLEISEEEKRKRKIQLELSHYKRLDSIAKTFRDSVNEADNPEEYEKRNKIKHQSDMKYASQKADAIKETNAIVNAESEAELSNASKMINFLHRQAVKKQKEAAEQAIKITKAEYEQKKITLHEYYNELRRLANENASKEIALVEQEIENITETFDKKIALSNSEKDIQALLTEKTIALAEAREKLNEIDRDAIVTVEELTGKEKKQADTLQRRTDAVLLSISKSLDDERKKAYSTTFEDEQKAEYDALVKSHALKLALIENTAQKQSDIEEARAKQAQELRLLEIRQEREKEQNKLTLQVKFAGDSAKALKGFMDSGLVQSKKAFKVYQALAIAEATVTTYKNAVDAYSQYAKTSLPMAIAAAAAAIGMGLAQVAQIKAQTPGYAEGGLIGGKSPHPKADNIDIRATAGEYMQPVSAVQKYGIRVMNAIRSLQIPKESLQNLVLGTGAGLNFPTPSFMLAGGGTVPSYNVKQTHTNETYKPSNIVINLTNKGVPLDIDKQSRRQDKGKEVIDIVLSYAETNKGGFTNALKGMINGR